MNPQATSDTAAEGCIFLLRHGATRADGHRRFIGQTDLPLSPLGRRQALAWRRWFAGRWLARVYTSDLRRAWDTARIVAGRGPFPEALPALREIHLGEWEGQAMEAVRHRFPMEFQRRGADLAGFRPPGGESFGDLQARVWPAFQRLSAQNPGDLLIVAHAGVIRVLVCRLLGMPLEHLFRLQQDTGALTILQRRKGGFRLQALNRPPACAFLAGAAPQPP
jgi:broad specificity phosphatase PhoE